VGDLAVHIPVPVSGATAVKSFAAGQYSGAVTWQYKDGAAWQAMPGTLFQPGTEYKAGVILYPAPGHAFSGLAVSSVSYTGGSLDTVAAQIDPDGSIPGIGIGFAATGKILVNDWDLTQRVFPPEKGKMAVNNISSSFQYTGSVTWTPNPGVNGFQGGVSYIANVKLKAASGYTFTGVSSFTHGGALNGGSIVPSLTNSGADAELDISFPQIPADTIVTDLDLSERVPRPVSGGLPVTTVSGPQYSGTLVWGKAESNIANIVWGSINNIPFTGTTLFTGNIQYAAKLTLTAAPGYTFTGLGEGRYAPSPCFTYRGPNVWGGEPTTTINGTGDEAELIIRFNPDRVTKSFGPASNTDSALYLLVNRTTGDITLPPGTETLSPVTLSRISSPATTPSTVVIDGGGRVLKGSYMTSPLITLVGPAPGVYGNELKVTLKNITLRGTNNSDAPLIKLEGKATLILESGAILEGNTNDTTATDPNHSTYPLFMGAAVNVGADSALEMRAGSEIRNNKTITAMGTNQGAGVYVNGGIFTMNGGAISGNTHEAQNDNSLGGGVYVASGTFTMNGGSISGNTVTSKGGGVYVKDGTFNMNGGSITGNTAYNFTKYINGGGVYVEAGNFTMTGGSITNNRASSSAPEAANGGGVYFSGTDFTMKGGRIENNRAEARADVKNGNGGGVYVKAGNFTMSGDSSITNNTASNSADGDSGYGGGVYKEGTGLFTMSVRSVISGNTARYGGGVYIVMGGTAADTYFTMSHNKCEISGNKAVAAADTGGGVYMTGPGIFKNWGAIKNNEVAATGSGGGVYMAAGAKCENSSIISGNTVLGANSGGGVYVTGTGTLFEMSAGQITDNEAVGLYTSGGVCVASGFFTLSGMGVVTLNRAWGGGTTGGVKNAGGTVSLRSGGSSYNYANGAISNE
jgi:hypothetical protein